MTKEEFEKIKTSCLISDDQDYILEQAKLVAESQNPYFICDFPEYIQKEKLTREVMKVLEDGILETKQPIPIYEFMFEMTDFGIETFDIKRFEDEIIKLNNPKLLYYTIIFIKGANVPKMLDALCKTQNEKYITLAKEDYEESYNKEEYPEEEVFTKEYYKQLEASKEKHYFPESLTKYSDPLFLTDFVINVLEKGNAYEIIELADYIEYLKDYKKLDEASSTKYLKQTQQKIEEKNDPLHSYEYAWSINSSDKDALSEIVIKSENPKLMYYFREIPGANKEKLEQAIENTGNQRYIDKINEEKESKLTKTEE